MDGEQVLEYLFHIAYENYQWSIFGASTFVFLTLSGTILLSRCSNESSETFDSNIENIGLRHDIGCIASSIIKFSNEFSLRLDLQNEEQACIRKIVNELQEKQDKIEESLYSSE